MNKKRKIQLTILIILTVALVGYLIFIISKTVYSIVNDSKNSKQILNEFNEMYEKGGTETILFASPKCDWCKKFVLVLDEIKDESNFKYYYLNVDKLYKGDLEEITSKLNINFQAIPKLIIIRNKQVIVESTGLKTKEETIELLAKAEILKNDYREEQ